MNSAISVRNLTKMYGDFTAVDSINLDVKSGQVYGFVGPNGAGKTTSIKSIIGAITPTSGEISINGFDISTDPVKSRESIGYIPETTTSLYFDMPAIKFVTYMGQLKGLSKNVSRQEAEYLLDLVGMTYARDRKIGKMSTGMKQRVNIAQSLMADPDLLIADEPTLGLDPVGKRDFQALLTKIKDMGKTVFISSHILDELEKVVTDISVITRGKITFEGSFSELNKQFRSDTFYVQTNNLVATNNIIKDEGIEIVNERQIGTVVKLKNATIYELVKKLVSSNLEIQEIRAEDSPLQRLFFGNVQNADSQDSFNFEANLKEEI